MSTTILRDEKVEALLEDLRRLIGERRKLEEDDAGAAVEASQDEIERLRWKIASAVRSTARDRGSGRN